MGAPGDGGELQYGLDALEAKAKELETERVPTVGATPEKLPDNLATTAHLWQQLTASGARMEATFEAGSIEATRIAAAHRSAASAYKGVQQQATEALGTQMNGTDAPPPAVQTATPNTSTWPVSKEIVVGRYPSEPARDEMDWDEAAKIIHGGADVQALSIKYFRDQWQVYPGTLTDYRRIFAQRAEGWHGGAAETCDAAMKSLDSWWNDMGAECLRLAHEATTFADAHDKLVADHPTLKDVEDYNNANWEALGAQLNMSADAAKHMMWDDYQRRSDAALDAYSGTHLMEIKPGKPPAISGLQPVRSGELPEKPETPGVPGGGPGGGGGGGGGGGTPEMPKVPEMPSMSPASADPSAGQESGGGSPSGGSPSGGQGGGQPSGGAPSGGAPSGGLPKGTEGMPEVPGLEEPSLKPASAGGGGGGMGGGGGGMPAGPLGPAVGAETVAASPSGARGAGGGVPGAPGGAGAGGMGGGMGGMGGGHGQGQGKEKRRNPNLSEDEDLYVEDRAYTEAVIGRRARKDAKDNK
ncbi:hypothetical protein A5722_00480 [Mycobacterium vulneris]|nr:hypothetical protein A5722_00480 [Mycolicibacterium vulneris]OCB68167.1 hypothetical protein A5729_04595 [Mycolicibacterium vulneris]